MKRLAILLLALGFISISCAATIPPRVMPLGGTPRVETIGSTIGMDLFDLDQELGTPHGTATCNLPFDIEGEVIMTSGRSFMWKHVFTNMPKEVYNNTTIEVCVIGGLVVAEQRKLVFIKGGLEYTVHSYLNDRDLLQGIMDNLLKTDPSQYPTEDMPRDKGFEI